MRYEKKSGWEPGKDKHWINSNSLYVKLHALQSLDEVHLTENLVKTTVDEIVSENGFR